MSVRNFSLFLALRYLKPKRTFVSVITVISVLGVTLGITVLILVIAVMKGFELELQRKVLGFDAHLVVTNSEVMQDWPDVARECEKQPGVLATAPFVQGPVLVEFQNRRLAPKIRGIDPELEEKVIPIKEYLIEGEYDLDGSKTVLGSDLARTLGAGVGDKITVFSPGNLNEVLKELDRIEKEDDKSAVPNLKQMLLPTELEVTGIFESGRDLYDSEFLLVPLHIGQEVYNLGGAAHGIAIRTTDPFKADVIRDALNNALDPPNSAMSWIDLNRQMFDAIRTERNVMLIILMIIVIVAAFCITNTLITVTTEKTRDIGILKALGASSTQVMLVFFIQGCLVGILGNITGLALGMFLVQYRNEASQLLTSVFGIEVFPRSVYQFSQIPAQVVPSDVVIICVSAFVICSVAALLPAWFAARLDPVKALRHE